MSITYAFINVRLTGTKKQVITTGNLELELQEDENNLTITNALPMHDEVGMLQEAFTFRLINKTSVDTNYILKLADITVGEKLDTSIVKYGLTKDGVGEPALLSTVENNTFDSGVIKGNQTIEYTLRLWIDASVEDNSLIKDKSLSYRVEVEVSQEIAEIEVVPEEETVRGILFAEENLATETCKTYDDGTDTFLVGRCSQNYVWYSGKLWRVVLKNNETGAIKMITDNSITVMSNDGVYGFENSYMDQWLTQEFLPTLRNYKQFLVVNSVWDVTPRSFSDCVIRPDGTVTVTRTVGALNTYEFSTTYNNSDGLATSQTSYLTNGFKWYTLTPGLNYKGNLMDGSWQISSTGKIESVVEGYAIYGVRPAVNLKGNIRVFGGDGSISNPYRLTGDEQETIHGTTLLSTRYSGEYIKFNNGLYRIVGTEDGFTKITAVNAPSELYANTIYTDVYPSYFSNPNTTIRKSLKNYYDNHIETAYKNMIKEDATWYQGKIEPEDNYKLSMCQTADDNVSMCECQKVTDSNYVTTTAIGLPAVGEMFTSRIVRGEEEYFWLLTRASSGIYAMLSPYASNKNPDGYEGSVRPSMYLKSNVVISSTNTGDGTYESPYDIELAS